MQSFNGFAIPEVVACVMALLTNANPVASKSIILELLKWEGQSLSRRFGAMAISPNIVSARQCHPILRLIHAKSPKIAPATRKIMCSSSMLYFHPFCILYALFFYSLRFYS